MISLPATDVVATVDAPRRWSDVEHLGTHVILEYYGCSPAKLDDPVELEKVFVASVSAMRANVVSHHFHRFSPHGVSGVVVISESHVSVHTWPEYGYAAVDIFTCGEVVDPWLAHQYLVDELQPERVSTMELKRGAFDVPSGTLPAAYDVAPIDDAGDS